MDNHPKVVVMPVREEAKEKENAADSPPTDGGGGGVNGGDNNLTPLQLRAISMLATGWRKTNAAKELGIDRSTLHRWCHDPAFSAALEEALAEFNDDIMADARSSCGLAMRTLDSVMMDGMGGAAAVSAAGIVLRMTGFYKTR